MLQHTPSHSLRLTCATTHSEPQPLPHVCYNTLTSHAFNSGVLQHTPKHLQAGDCSPCSPWLSSSTQPHMAHSGRALLEALEGLLLPPSLSPPFPFIIFFLTSFLFSSFFAHFFFFILQSHLVVSLAMFFLLLSQSQNHNYSFTSGSAKVCSFELQVGARY